MDRYSNCSIHDIEWLEKMEKILWQMAIILFTSLSLFLPVDSSLAASYTMVAPKDSLNVRLSHDSAKTPVQVKGWICTTKLFEKSQSINKEVKKRGVDSLRRYHSFAREIIEMDKVTKGLDKGVFFNTLNLSSVTEPTGKASTMYVSSGGKTWQHCFTKQEASANRKELVRWAKYLLSKLKPIAFIPEKINFSTTAPNVEVTRTVRVVNIDEYETQNIKLQLYDILDVNVANVNGVPYHGENISLSPGSSVEVTLALKSSKITTIDGASQFIRAVNDSEKLGTFGLGYAKIVGKVSPVSLKVEIFDATDVADGITQKGGLATGTKSSTMIGKPVDEIIISKSAKNKRTGYVADGNARLLIRVQTNAPDRRVLFGMAGTGEYGIFDHLNKKRNATHIVEDLVQIDKKKNTYQATAVMKAPERFPNRTHSFGFSVCLESLENHGKCDTKTEFRQQIGIAPAPVVLVHGLWAGPASWGTASHHGLKQSLQQNGYKVMAIGYNSSKGPTETMMYNTTLLSGVIAGLCNAFMGNGFACTKADIVAHSMGGLVARKFIKDNIYYKNTYDYFQGTVRRLITIDTPHLGSGFANMLLVGDISKKSEWLREDGLINNCISKHESIKEKFRKLFYKKTTYSGRQYIKNTVIPLLFATGKDVDTAIRDIAIRSDFLASLNSSRQKVPAFAIIGDTGKDLLRTNLFGNKLALRGGLALKYTGCTHDDLFNHERSDGIVGYSSQVGHISSKIVLSGVPHLGEGSNPKVIKWVMKMLLVPLNKFSNEARYFPKSFKGAPALSPRISLARSKSITDYILDFLIPSAMAGDGEISLKIDDVTPKLGSVITLQIVAKEPVQSLMLNGLAEGNNDFEIISSSLNTWKIRVPNNFSGNKVVTAIAVINGEVHKSNPVKISYRFLMSNLLRIRFSATEPIYLSPGRTEKLSVMGWFSDGYARDISAAYTGVAYSERIIDGFSKKDGDSPIISVSPDGLISALKIGKADVVAQAGKFRIERQVIVGDFFGSKLKNK